MECDFLCLKVQVSNSFRNYISVSLIVFGAIVAGARDLSFDSYSYGVVSICNLSSAIYVTTVAHYGDDL